MASTNTPNAATMNGGEFKLVEFLASREAAVKEAREALELHKAVSKFSMVAREIVVAILLGNPIPGLSGDSGTVVPIITRAPQVRAAAAPARRISASPETPETAPKGKDRAVGPSGRKRKYSTARVERFKKLLMKGWSASRAAKSVRVHNATAQRWAQDMRAEAASAGNPFPEPKSNGKNGVKRAKPVKVASASSNGMNGHAQKPSDSTSTAAPTSFSLDGVLEVLRGSNGLKFDDLKKHYGLGPKDKKQAVSLWQAISPGFRAGTITKDTQGTLRAG